jgi:hypothetical protein
MRFYLKKGAGKLSEISSNFILAINSYSYKKNDFVAKVGM